ncbi:DegT/DnrJ/EryC1/StrS family aminotransferase [Halorarum salinum]|uniref:DegT/DnrJ/EryC1/StrS family aminotransferase n=1 Tax=Halorarum salinum TaxID=2743089 RepID=A0A7D5L8B8_9EURY|nr:DegT/DnrJ/EryC1/StrS family aminotransferase [Halobaculum salinum]QLG60391.1 DegT/DnrJ/EryC1/StrS family aminotransferase [Halobaculum salinum]
MTGEASIADPELGDAAIDRVVDVLESGQLADGPEVRAFESEFADYCAADHAVATSNGTTALHAALEAVGVEPGSRVITTPFSFVATANAIRHAGGVPVFADVDPETYNLDPDGVEELLEGDEPVDAIVAVHLYGLPAPMDRLGELADAYDVPLVEDAAQAHGAEFDGTPVGAIGTVGTFSFYPTKNMTTGEGGMITTDDEEVAEAASRFVNHGRAAAGYEHVELGHNFRMTSMAAAIGRAQLGRLDGFVERRRENARILTDALAGSPCVTPAEPAYARHAYHQYTVRCGNRDGVKEALAERGVGSAVYYPTNIHDQPAYAGDFGRAPTAERIADEVLSLPVHPNVTPETAAHIGDVLADEVEVAHV